MGWVYLERNGLGMFQCQELNHTGLIQAFSAKNAGNMALHTGADPQIVIGRRHVFLQHLGLEMSKLTAAQQTHGVNIQVVDETSLGMGAWKYEDAFPDTDALLTKIPGIILTIFTADCLPLFVYDPVTPAIGIIHAGWRGTIAQIAYLALTKMTAFFGTNPSDCWVAIGPGIGTECFQVSQDLATRFRELCPEAVSHLQDNHFIDLGAANKHFLVAAGVPPQRIIPSNQCTCCGRETFFSYRAAGVSDQVRGCDGRMMGLIALQ